MQRSGENQGVRPPLAPFDEESTRQKVKMAQDAWNRLQPFGADAHTVPHGSTAQQSLAVGCIFLFSHSLCGSGCDVLLARDARRA